MTTRSGVIPTAEMPSERTFVTEVATGLGMVGEADLDSVIARRSAQMSNITAAHWDQLTGLWNSRGYEEEFRAGFRNGQAFLDAAEALNGRRPRIIEWTGGRRPPGDEVVPSDLRVDHVYLVSCKYISRILHNPSPARLVEGLLSQAPVEDSRDWYHRIAPVEYQALYEECVDAADGPPLPARAEELTPTERTRLALALRTGWPHNAAHAYAALCQAVSEATARTWRSRITPRNAEIVLWRLLRIGSAPYFILGTSPDGSMRLRVDTPWDWHQVFRLRHLEVVAQEGGQPRVGWLAVCENCRTSEEYKVNGHVEIRWSHGRFRQPPEAKVYLDSPHSSVPGYHPL